ncbi:MAG: NTP transferase domain-containing protein [Thermoplasmataceae archaeon]
MNVHFLIMAGGKGTRFGDAEKCMSTVNGTTILGHLLNQISAISQTLTVSTTVRHLKTSEFCISRRIPVIYTAGDDYVEDLIKSLIEINRVPTVVLGSDTYFTDLPYFIKMIESSLKKEKMIIEFLQHKTMTGISLFNKIPENGNVMDYEEINSEWDFVININTKDDLKTATSRHE